MSERQIHEWIASEAITLLDAFRAKGCSPAETLAVLCATIAALAMMQGRTDIPEMSVNEITGGAVNEMERRKAREQWPN